MGIYFFLITIISIYSLLNTYIIFKGWQFILVIFPDASKKLYFIITVMLALVYIIAMFVFRGYHSNFSKIILNMGSLWFVFMIYAFVFFVSVDILRLIAYIIKPLWYFGISHNKELIVISSSLFILFILGIFIIGDKMAKNPKVTTYNIDILKKVENIKKMKIVFISDVHLGEVIGRDRLKEMVDLAISLSPDIVLLGGDIIEGDVQIFLSEKMDEELRRLKPKYGVYGILGNHEYYAAGQSMEKILEAFKKSGVKMLVDKKVLVNDSFYIVGRDDRGIERLKNQKRMVINELLNEVDFSKPVIVLDHQPFDLKDSYLNNIDLQLSGHTHHGQFWPNNLITNLIYEVDWGLLKKQDTNIIVSCGAGTWGPQIRVGSYSEIVEINLNFDNFY